MRREMITVHLACETGRVVSNRHEFEPISNATFLQQARCQSKTTAKVGRHWSCVKNCRKTGTRTRSRRPANPAETPQTRADAVEDPSLHGTVHVQPETGEVHEREEH